MTREEFKHIYDQYFDAIRNYIYFRSGDTELATDIAQEVFLKLWQKQISHPSVKALLYKMASDMFVSFLRRNKLADEYAQEFRLQYTDASHENKADDERRMKYQKALGKLPDKQRVAFLMNKMEGLTQKEIAENLGLSIKAIEKRIAQAVKFLRTSVNE